MTINMSINDTVIEAPDGSSVLDVFYASDTYISQLFKDPDTKPVGVCRNLKA